jgi:hypothetical protein
MTILNTIQTVERSIDAGGWVAIIFGIVLIGLSAMFITSMIKDGEYSVVLVILCIIASFFGIGLMSAAYDFCYTETEVTQYQVLIDDNYTFKEFADKYELIDRQGEIYIIQELEGEAE